MSRKRYLEAEIEEICFDAEKMAFVAGPRQCGKTTLAKYLLKERKRGNYYNWDETKFRRNWVKDPSHVVETTKSNKEIPLIILDELHKAKGWKQALKGIYDTLMARCDILVTGSARLNVYRKGSDSLMGRYYHFRLHPFSLKEMSRTKTCFDVDGLIDGLFNRALTIQKSHREHLLLLDRFGPFPEPLFAANTRTLNLWRRNRVEKLVREDLRDMSRIVELSQVEMLVSLLPERVGSLFSCGALAQDLETTYTTIRRWMNYLNQLYYYFDLKPYSKRLVNSIRKSKKVYLWDWSEIENDADRFENLIASHLLKYCHYLTDTGVGFFELRYLRTKTHKEIDFLILRDKQPWLPVEAKLNNDKCSMNWKSFLPFLPCKRAIQVTKKTGVFKRYPIYDGEVLAISADEFLSYLI